jgi:hypothetical protein
MFVTLFKEITLLNLVPEFRETECALHNLQGVDGCATCGGTDLKKFKGAGLKSSGMHCYIKYSAITFM